jgi:GntR family transcriptional regulator/MocR family aminotransferase
MMKGDRSLEAKVRRPLNRVGLSPAYREIYRRIRDAIDTGRLGPGDRIPSARGMASELGVARGTVEEAYQLLVAEGYLVRRGAAGSIVSPEIGANGVARDTPLDRVRRARVTPKRATAPPVAPRPSPFQMGVPALDAFPKAQWTRIAARQARRLGQSDLLYPDPLGFAPLRESIARYLALGRGIACSPDQIVITAGYKGALELVALALLKPEDTVWTEDPGYPIAYRLLAAMGVRVANIPVDAEGICIATAESMVPEGRLAVVTPSHQFPTCVTLSLSRRLALLAWAKQTKSWIVEDDYDGEFHYAGRPLPALKSIDRADRVLYAGSFSKTLYPGLRLGYLVLPESLVARVGAVARVRNMGPATHLQAVVAGFMEEGHFGRHLRRMRNLYAARRSALIEALQRTLGDELELRVASGGLQLLANVPDSRRDVVLVAQAQAQGYALHALSTHCQRVRGQNALLLPFTNVPEASALRICQRLKTAFADGPR